LLIIAARNHVAILNLLQIIPRSISAEFDGQLLAHPHRRIARRLQGLIPIPGRQPARYPVSAKNLKFILGAARIWREQRVWDFEGRGR